MIIVPDIVLTSVGKTRCQVLNVLTSFKESFECTNKVLNLLAFYVFPFYVPVQITAAA